MSKRQKVVIPPRFEDTKHPEFRCFYTTGVFGTLNPNDPQIIFYLDHLEPETTNDPKPGAQKLKKVIREAQAEIHMTPTQFKSIALWMQRHIEAYEKVFGKIPMEPKDDKKPPPSGMIT